MEFNTAFLEFVVFGALAGGACTAIAIIIKNNLAATVMGTFVGSLIAGGLLFLKKNNDLKSEFFHLEKRIEKLSSLLEEQKSDVDEQIYYLQKRIKLLSSRPEEQTSDVAATPN